MQTRSVITHPAQDQTFRASLCMALWQSFDGALPGGLSVWRPGEPGGWDCGTANQRHAWHDGTRVTPNIGFLTRLALGQPRCKIISHIHARRHAVDLTMCMCWWSCTSHTLAWGKEPSSSLFLSCAPVRRCRTNRDHDSSTSLRLPDGLARPWPRLAGSVPTRLHLCRFPGRHVLVGCNLDDVLDSRG